MIKQSKKIEARFIFLEIKLLTLTNQST